MKATATPEQHNGKRPRLQILVHLNGRDQWVTVDGDYNLEWAEWEAARRGRLHQEARIVWEAAR